MIDDRGLEAVRDVSFEVRGGEIVGLAGVDANGQSELIDAIAGLRHPASGRIVVDGHDLTHANAKESLDAGVGHIPEDRHRRGLVLPFSLTENIALHGYRTPPNSRYGFLNLGRDGRAARGVCSRSSTSAADSRRHRPARSPAATSRRSCSRARSTAIRRC